MKKMTGNHFDKREQPQDDAEDGSTGHIPVLLNEVIAALAPLDASVVVDGTFGAGGYAREIANRGAQVLAIDRDPQAIRHGRRLADEFTGRIQLIEGRHSKLDQLATTAGHASVDAVTLDLGISSMQVDQAGRGFSFNKDGPLDMRMEQSGPSAAEAVNHLAYKDLVRVIGTLGEERAAVRIAHAIVDRRAARKFERTVDLAAVIAKAAPARGPTRLHPATRTFQALRMFINRELEELVSALYAAERLLKTGGRIAIVSFHSLEDRIVKRFLAGGGPRSTRSRHLPEVEIQALAFDLSGRRLVRPSQSELAANPRARSAKLRSGLRSNTQARETDLEPYRLPRLAQLETLAC